MKSVRDPTHFLLHGLVQAARFQRGLADAAVAHLKWGQALDQEPTGIVDRLSGLACPADVDQQLTHNALMSHRNFKNAQPVDQRAAPELIGCVQLQLYRPTYVFEK